jgi:hypothetical protein
VDGPLKPGDLVVVEGVQSLRPGQRLDPQPFLQAQLDGPKDSPAKAPDANR